MTAARLRPASRAGLLAAAVAGVASCREAPVPQTAEATRVVEVAPPPLPACESSGPPRVDTLATGLEVPWDVAFLPDGRALVTERPGRVRSLDAWGRLDPEPWAELPVFSSATSEIGLLAIDTSPERPSEVYVAATFQAPGTGIVGGVGRAARRLARALDPEGGHATTFRVTRLLDRDGRGVEPEVVVDGLPSFMIHGGGTLRFGPDGLLYVTNGDAAEPARAQDPRSTRGKILRYTASGAIPPDNPRPGSPVYASGVRHVQGIGWLGGGEMVAIDHGPSGLPAELGRVDHDELDVVTPAANLGWPIATGATEGGGLVSPIAVWSPAIAPAGLAVYRGEHPLWEGSVFVTALRGTSLRRLRLERTADGTPRVACEEVLFSGTYGRLRLVRMAPDGALWIGTSNRDGRGLPRAGDDLLLRVHPPEA